MYEFLRRWFLNIMLSVVVGLLGAVPLAGATGFDRERYTHSVTSLEVTCGFILFLLSLAVLDPAWRGLRRLFAAPGRSEARPSRAATLGLLGSGTVCVITSLYFAWAASTVNPAADYARQMQEAMRSVNFQNVGVNVSMPPVPEFHSGGGSGAMILTVLAFALGVGLIGLGVWATLPPGAGGYAHAPKPAPVPAADATSL